VRAVLLLVRQVQELGHADSGETPLSFILVNNLCSPNRCVSRIRFTASRHSHGLRIRRFSLLSFSVLVQFRAYKYLYVL
jgi:hypothetical protein